MMKINIEKVINFLLYEKYNKEFVVIDGFMRHQDGLNFYEWMYRNGIISKEDLESKLLEFKEMED